MGEGKEGMRGFCAALSVMMFLAVDGGTAPADSLSFPGDVLVITRDDLSEYNIHTLDDIIRLVPGAAVWRKGPPASEGALMLDGRSPRGVLILLNGEPVTDPFDLDQLDNFIPFSRLERIEVHYRASPFLSGDISAAAAINVVLEDGGRPAPSSELEFTFGRGNRRARRIWFSTPRAEIGGMIAYDEYLQDEFESYITDPYRKLGRYDGRSVLLELDLLRGAGQGMRLRLHKYEDTYVGTVYSTSEDLRYDGYDAGLGYRRGGLDLSIRQRVVNLSRLGTRRSALLLGGLLRWSGSFRGLDGRVFLSGERSSFDLLIRSAAIEPSMHRVEGGIQAVWNTGPNLRWHTGFYGGEQSEIGAYIAGEAGLSWSGNNYLRPRAAARRVMRAPSAQEIFQPESLLALNGVEYLPAGDTGLEPELSEEITIGADLMGSLTIDLFAREEKRRIVPVDGLYGNVDGGRVTGARSRYAESGEMFGFHYGVNASIELFGERSDFTRGIPEYRVRGGLLVRRAVFKATETLSLRWDTEVVGERKWEEYDLKGYTTNDLSCSMTLLRARITFQYRNILNEEYETYPGYLMPGRHYIIGIWWELLD
jgi:outer membrane receptor protein involved in Fe transport